MSGVFYHLNRGESIHKVGREKEKERGRERHNQENSPTKEGTDEPSPVTAAEGTAGTGSGERDGQLKNSRSSSLLSGRKQIGARGMLLKMKAKMEEAMLSPRLGHSKDEDEEDSMHASGNGEEYGSMNNSMNDMERESNMNASGTMEEAAPSAHSEKKEEPATEKVPGITTTDTDRLDESESTGEEPEKRKGLTKPRFKLNLPPREEPVLGRNRSSSVGENAYVRSPLEDVQEPWSAGRKRLSSLCFTPAGKVYFFSDLDAARKVLLSPKLQLVTQLSKRVDSADCKRIALTLVKIFEANGRALELLEWAIRHEIKSSVDQHTVFREDSLCNQIIGQYFTLVGHNYLRQLLRTEVMKVLRAPSTSDKKVADSASALLKEICSSIVYCPSQISNVCYILHKELSKHFPTGRGHGSIIGSFYMLRFICPAILSPARMGFLEGNQKAPSVEVTRHLVAVAKLLQYLANTSIRTTILTQHSSPAEKERSVKWEKFLRTKIPLYNEFIAALTSEELFTRSSCSSSNHAANYVHGMTSGQRGVYSSPAVTMEEEAAEMLALQEFISSINNPLGSSYRQNGMCKCVSVPERFSLVFSKAEKAMVDYFDGIVRDTQQGVIAIPEAGTVTETQADATGEKNSEAPTSPPTGARYMLLSGASMSVGFFSILKKMFGFSSGECLEFTTHILYDLMHALGKTECRHFKSMTRMDASFFNLATGFISLSCLGWCFVDILPDSNISERDSNFFIMCNVVFSSEADAWLRHKKRQTQPVCAMIAGYLAGWCQESHGRELVTKEIQCKGRGDICCQFIVCPPSKLTDHLKRFVAKSEERSAGMTERDAQRALEETLASPRAKVSFRDDILSPRFLMSPRTPPPVVPSPPLSGKEPAKFMALCGEAPTRSRPSFDDMYIETSKKYSSDTDLRARQVESARAHFGKRGYSTNISPRGKGWFVRTMLQKKPLSVKRKKSVKQRKDVKVCESGDLAADLLCAMESRIDEQLSDFRRDYSTGSVVLAKNRYVLVRCQTFITEFHSLIRELFGPRSTSSALELASNVMFDFGRGLGSADLRRFVSGPLAAAHVAECQLAFQAHLTHTGWGKVVVHDISNASAKRANEYYMMFDLYHSMEAASWDKRRVSEQGSGIRQHNGAPLSPSSCRPGCYMTAGYSSGWFSEFWGRTMAAVEVSCAGNSDEGGCCRFVVAPPHHIQHYLRFYGAALNQAGHTWPMVHLFSTDEQGERYPWTHSLAPTAGLGASA